MTCALTAAFKKTTAKQNDSKTTAKQNDSKSNVCEKKQLSMPDLRSGLPFHAQVRDNRAYSASC